MSRFTETKKVNIIDSNGNEGSYIIDKYTGLSANIVSLGGLKVTSPVRLVGTAFNNGSKDPNFWTETVTGSGSVSQSGEITLSTGTTADSTAKYESVRKSRKITGRDNQFRLVGRQLEEASANCIRRAGAYHSTDGFPDYRVKVSSNDSEVDYISNKLVAGTGISKTENNDGGNETLTIANTQTSAVWGNITGTLSDQTDLQDALTLQYFTDNADLDFDSNSNFENQIAASLYLNKIGDK